MFNTDEWKRLLGYRHVIGMFHSSRRVFIALKKKKKVKKVVFTTLISRELQNNSRGCENPLKVIKDFNKKVQQYNKSVKEQMTERNNEIICVRISHPCELSCNNLHINAV